MTSYIVRKINIVLHYLLLPGHFKYSTRTLFFSSCNSHLYSKHQTIYTLKFKKNQLSKLYNQKDKLHVAKACFSKEAYKLVTITSCNKQSSMLTPIYYTWEGLKSTFQELPMLRKNRVHNTLVLFTWSFSTKSQTASFIDVLQQLDSKQMAVY